MSEREVALRAARKEAEMITNNKAWTGARSQLSFSDVAHLVDQLTTAERERDEARRERDAYAQTAWWAKEFALELLPLVKAAVAGRPLTDSELDLAIESNANAQRIKNAWETAVKLTAVRALDAAEGA